MTDSCRFDYIIIGNGLAGLQLGLKMASDAFFDDKFIAFIDPSEKDVNDKTWSFWETGPSQWNKMAFKTWGSAAVISSKKTIHLKLSPYSYKSIRSIDFYTHSKAILKKHINFTFIKEYVEFVQEDDKAKVQTNLNKYEALHVFDSRIPKDYYNTSKKYTSITQHFKGWVINTKTDQFNPESLTMMDYRLKDGHQTTFTYVLPFSKKEALIEFTYFTAEVVKEDTYDSFIKTYIKDYLKIDDYTVIETETGQIPMTNFPFESFNTKKLTKIGTGGGWVKGSTGYAFKHTEKKVSKIIENLKENKNPSKGFFKNRHKFYNKVFLKVLKDDNHKGEWIFQQFYSKNTVQTMFRFLDEESSFFEELKIMWSLFSWPFIKAFFKTL